MPAIIGICAPAWSEGGLYWDAPALLGVRRGARLSSVAGNVRPGTPGTSAAAGLLERRSRGNICEPNGPPMMLPSAESPESKRALVLKSVVGMILLRLKLPSEQTLPPPSVTPMA